MANDQPVGAWSVEVQPAQAPDITKPHHVMVHASGGQLSMTIDGAKVGSYDSPAECGALTIRAWGAAFAFTSRSPADRPAPLAGRGAAVRPERRRGAIDDEHYKYGDETGLRASTEQGKRFTQ